MSTRQRFRVQGMIIGNSQEDSRRVRLSLMRYMNLAWILLMRNISEQIANRFRSEENQGEEEKSVREILTNINRDKRKSETLCVCVCVSIKQWFWLFAMSDIDVRSKHISHQWLWCRLQTWKAWEHACKYAPFAPLFLSNNFARRSLILWVSSNRVLQRANASDFKATISLKRRVGLTLEVFGFFNSQQKMKRLFYILHNSFHWMTWLLAFDSEDKLNGCH